MRHGRVTKATKEPAHILVVGGGYVGMYTALRLQRRLKGRLVPAHDLLRDPAQQPVTPPDAAPNARELQGSSDAQPERRPPRPRGPADHADTAPHAVEPASGAARDDAALPGPSGAPHGGPAGTATDGGTEHADDGAEGDGQPPSEVTITVLDPDPYMTYQPFLPEAAAGSLSPRHVVVPLRRVLPGCRVLVGEARRIDHDRRIAYVSTLATAETDAATRSGASVPPPLGASPQGARPAGGPPRSDDGGRAPEPRTLELPYSELILAPGSVSRALPVPGLAEHAIGFKTIEEAIGLRNHVLEQLDIASSTRDPAVRDAALTFVFVGGGYAGVEALAELEDMARYACRYYHNVSADDLRFLLVEAEDRILPEVGAEMGGHALRELRSRNIDVRLGTRLDSCTGRVAALSDGSRHPARTIVWTAGVKPHPVLAATGLPLTEKGRLLCEPTLRVEGTPHAWAAGDAAAVPDLAAAEAAREDGAGEQTEEPENSHRSGSCGGGDPHAQLCAPNAQHAVRQARRLADNLVASLDGKPLTPYRHAHAGSVASLGLHKGVARVYGRKFKGRPAWLLHRVYHLSRVPTFNRKARVLSEWVLSGLFKREIVSLGSLEHPRAEFELAAGGRRPSEDS